MGINTDRLGPAPTPLKGFTANIIQPMGAITLSLLAGKAPRTSATMADFLVVKAPFLYNAILGRLTLNNLTAVTSTYHLKMKFPTDLWVCGGQVLAQDCYARELRYEVQEVKTIREAREAARAHPTLGKWDEEVRDEQSLRQAKPNEPLELVSVDPQRPERTVWVETKMAPKLRQVVKRLLFEHQDVFT
ncbi:uncharacterized protein LOC118348669 [Juglans regia]|uniref:Uncharacterized protein LOC118348669 n=1 Tax=Juglans regia TaxID=51240 RepID=A0A6P9ES04_JUGRE|nr:uncharacterized protein LOC118348669 [Juglans regia]